MSYSERAWWWVMWWALCCIVAPLTVVLSQQPQPPRNHGITIVGRALPDTLTIYEWDSVVVRTQVAAMCAPGDTVLRYWWHLHGPRTVTQTPKRGVFLLRCGPRPQ